MPTEPIEVEVVSIDDVAPSRPSPEAPKAKVETNPQQEAWQKFQGRIRTLDRRWWPLWSLLGLVFVVLFLTVGLVFGTLFIIFKMIKGVLGMLLGPFRNHPTHLVRR